MYNFSSADIITPSQSLKFIHNITDVDKIPKLTEGFIILGYFNYFYKKQTFETKEIVINNDIIECEIFDINKLNNFDRQLIINIFLKTEVEVTEDNDDIYQKNYKTNNYKLCIYYRNKKSKIYKFKNHHFLISNEQSFYLKDYENIMREEKLRRILF